jgi:hypothetical protein
MKEVAMKSKHLIKGISFVIIFFLTLNSSLMITNAELKEVKLDLFPSNSFINALNMAPGDSVTSNIIIHYKENRESADVKVDPRIQSGSELLFNNLDLKVNEGSDTLFEGKLQDFQDFLIESVSDKENILTFTVTLPKNSLNELQGKNVIIAFDFITEYGDLINPTQNGILPETATNIFNYLFTGLILLISGFILKNIQIRKQE